MNKFNRRVLLIEDSPDTMALIVVALQRDNIEVVAVADGMSGLYEYHLAFKEERCFPVIIIDIALATAHNLPSIDGFTVGRNVRNLENASKAIPRASHIYYTGYPEHVYKAQLLKVEADAYIVKDAPEKLLEIVLLKLEEVKNSWASNES